MTDGWKTFAELTVADFSVHLEAVMLDMAKLLCAKRLSYGPHNLTKFGDTGVLVRASDKMERLIHMHREGLETTAVGEDALDAWRDIAGYALLVLVAHHLEEDV